MTPWTAACWAPPSMGFPRQEYWSELSFSSAGDLPKPGIESASPAMAGGFFTTELPGKLMNVLSATQLNMVKIIRFILCDLCHIF